MYSLCFGSQVSDEIMDPLFDVISGRFLNKWNEDEDDNENEKGADEKNVESDEETRLINEKTSTSIQSPKYSIIDDEF